MSDTGDSKGRKGSFRGFASKILGDQDEGDSAGDTAKVFLGSLLETGDKAKSEMYRIVAREVRAYLEALELHKDIQHMLTNYSLEVSASVHLKPLVEGEEGNSKVNFGLKKREADSAKTDEDHVAQDGGNTPSDQESVSHDSGHLASTGTDAVHSETVHSETVSTD